MPTKAATVICTEEELTTLRKWNNSMKAEKRLIERAKIILECHKGLQNKDIAKKLRIALSTVVKWRGRFVRKRIAGLQDSLRTGRPKIHNDKVRDSILKLLETKPPKGQARWDGKAIAEYLGIPKSIIWRILEKEGIQLQRTRSWCVSTDPEFTTKAANIIGLYLNPPDNAIVLSVDEKPSIQANERKIGYVETSSGKVVRGLKSTYKRNGVINLFAALDVATGQVKAQTTETKKRIDFQAFLDDILKTVSDKQEVHIILDNYCTHKKNDEWLKQHPNVYFHYTPTSASWLNQVEIWFGILTRKALRGTSFCSKEQLRQAIEDFIEVYHKNAKPFVWKKREVKGAQLRNTIANFRD